MLPLKVKILGSGSAGKKHRLVFKALPSVYQIIEDPEQADIISICTPNHTHYEIAMKYLDNSHIILVNPYCGSLEHMDNLIRKQKETGKFIFPVSQFRFVDHDPVGCSIKTYWTRNYNEYYHSWKGKREFSLGGCVFTHATHAIDLMLAHHPKPEIICCEAIDYQYGSLENHCIFSIDDKYINTTVGEYRRSANCFKFGDSLSGFAKQFRAIAEYLVKGKQCPDLPTVHDARDVIEVVTAVYYSEYILDPVILPIIDDHPFYKGWSELFEQRQLRSHATDRITI